MAELLQEDLFKETLTPAFLDQTVHIEGIGLKNAGRQKDFRDRHGC